MEQNKTSKQFILNVPFPVHRISCPKCKANFSIIAYAGNTWLHQMPGPGSPVFCPYCKTAIHEEGV